MDERMEADQRARNRFMVINLVRLSGVAFVLAGIAIIQGVIALPPLVAYVLIGIGLVDTFLVPTLLSRAWSSNRQP